ncbi:hypothetical protein XENOCAPTIV_013664 [Xenoophorus captivus]|uniref:Uncharacterized protein n=1 Tax=Xenoophorus captivus TaxID=1517983 RepID=A0ABV0SAD5_9TELE
MLKGIFKGSPAVSSEGANRRLLVYEHLIPLCESGDLQAEVAADIIGLLMLEGFYDVLRRNSQLASSIMQTLLSQVRRYYEPEQDLLPPVKLEPCIAAHGDQVYLQEPLAHLVSCTVHCLMWLQNTQRAASLNADDSDDDEEEEEGYKSELQTILESMSRRMIKCELEDFELKIQQLEETGHTDGPDGQYSDRTFRFLCDMTRFNIPACLGAFETYLEANFSLCVFFCGFRGLCILQGASAVGQQDPVEKAVTLQLGTLLTALNELVQTALLPGNCTVTLLRELSRTYTILTTLVKYVCICPGDHFSDCENPIVTFSCL